MELVSTVETMLAAFRLHHPEYWTAGVCDATCGLWSQVADAGG